MNFLLGEGLRNKIENRIVNVRYFKRNVVVIVLFLCWILFINNFYKFLIFKVLFFFRREIDCILRRKGCRELVIFRRSIFFLGC